MTNAFEQLRQRFNTLPPNSETLQKASKTLAAWLAANADKVAERKPSAEFNGTIMQYFHWYSPNDGSLWKTVQQEAPALAQAGFSALWLPPAYKGDRGVNDVGYAAYDLFDLGEFEQKGAVRTKYGTKDEYVAAVKAAQQAGMQVYADVVFNHKIGADAEEEFEAIPFDPNDRNHQLEGAQQIKSWTSFSFPGRGDTHSSMKWHWWHFDSVDYNSNRQDYRAVYRMKDKNFETKVDLRQGNYDYLMGCDLDMNHEQVRGELKYWGEWIIKTAGVNGFRLDAIKHIQGDFFNDWLDHLENYAQKDLFCVGEYWTEDFNTLSWYIGNAGGRLNLFDVPLHYNLYRASMSRGYYDMRTILDNTLMKNLPLFAVTFVDNHDTQPGQALESPVAPWFKPIAYAITLLRAEGYPCVFHPDYYGAPEHGLNSHQWMIDRLLFARTHFAYGAQYDYFDHYDVIGWTRLGTAEHPVAMAVILSDGLGGSKWMEVGKPNTAFYDITEHVKEPVYTNADGWGEFRCQGGSVSVWVLIESEDAGTDVLSALRSR